MEIYSIWVKAQNDSLKRVEGLIDEIAQAEGTEKFEPHVTLVSSIYSLEKAEEILDKIVKKKINVSFDSYSTGNSYFQRLLYPLYEANHSLILCLFPLYCSNIQA